MLHITVTGKVVEIRPPAPTNGINYTTFVLSERRWRNGQADLVLWMIAVPSFLEKAAASLVKEGKSIGVTGKNLQVVVTTAGNVPSQEAFWIEASELFIL